MAATEIAQHVKCFLQCLLVAMKTAMKVDHFEESCPSLADVQNSRMFKLLRLLVNT